MDIEKPPDFFPYFLFLQDTENGLSKCRYTVPVSPSSGAKSPHRGDNYFLAVVRRAAFGSTASTNFSVWKFYDL